jgi:SAM-dependent methyltransferase
MCSYGVCRTADLCAEWVKKLNLPRGAAFDVGCAVGRTSFDMSKTFDAVVGLDFSHKFVATADKLRSGASIDYVATMEGEATAAFSCAAPDDANLDRIKFIQGDACDLPRGIGPFSVIHGANLLCR